MIYFPSTHMIELIKHEDFGLLKEMIQKYEFHTIDFSYKSIDKETAPFIAKALIGLDIKVLNLGYNQLGLEGALGLVDYLKDTQVTSLDLTQNLIGEGVVELIKQLTNTSIQELKLAYNRIGAKGIALIKPLVNGSNIKIDLSHNLAYGV